MSRRPPALAVVALLSLVALGLATPFLAQPAQAAGDQVFAANPAIGAGDPFFSVYNRQTVAQSFTLSSTIWLKNLTLRLANDWNTANTITVLICTSTPSDSPSITVLANVSLGWPPASADNLTVPFSPWPILYAGQVYWIEVTNSAPQGSKGYEWHYSGDNYTDGHAAVYNGTTGVWTSYSTLDMYFVVFGEEVSADATPELALAVTPTNTVVEAGTAVRYTVAASNVGNGTAANVWLNLTLPNLFAYVSDTSGSGLNVTGNAYSWHWANLVPGTKAFELYLAASTAAANGESVNLTFSLSGRGTGNVTQPPVNETVHLLVAAPTLVLTIHADNDHPQPGNNVVYTLQVENTGLVAAHDVWLQALLDPALQVINYTADVPASGEHDLNWTLQDLAAGTTETISITVRVSGGIAANSYLTTYAQASYTNSVGVFLGTTRASPSTILVSANWVPLIEILVLGAAAGSLLVLLVWRRNRVDVEEVFLVYRDGVLISHLSRTLVQEKDEDVLSGMLTAVQEFVREAFHYGEDRELHQLDFGDYRILIERGQYVYLALVYSGGESAALRKKVRTVINRVEAAYGKTLASWDGDMDQVIGARDLIRDTLLGSSNHNHMPHALAESE